MRAVAITGRSRKGVGGPRTPEGRARALANLRQFRQAHDRHGVYAIDMAQPATRELADRIIQVLEGQDLLRPADRVTVNLLAVTLRRIQQAEEFLDRNGLVNSKGRVRPVAELLVKLLREAREYAAQLGMTPAARARLGLDTARTFDLAAALAEGAREEEQTA